MISPNDVLGVPRRADRICVVGVLNVTPDSFSDGGRYFTDGGADGSDVSAAVEHGLAMYADGADLIDIGGESTRPGARRVSAEDELARILPVIAALASHGVPMSVDTYRAVVAEQALAAGVTVVNDVSGGLADPAMAGVVRDAGCPWILMHWRGHSERMQERAVYADVVREVRDELDERVSAAVAAGVAPAQLVIDPGLGFAKTAEHNWALLAAVDEFVATGVPVLVAASRKSFLGRLLAGADGTLRPTDDRGDATVAITTHCAERGVWGVRVHDVRPSVDAALTVAAITAARS